MAVIDRDAGDRGKTDGWSAANYAQAYGSSETREAECKRRAADLYPIKEQSAQRVGYRTGFLLGWDQYLREQDEDD